MRRGRLNKKSIILIFIVAIFTIFSYGFDQLVIRTEDKLRNLKINFQNIENKLSKMKHSQTHYLISRKQIILTYYQLFFGEIF